MKLYYNEISPNARKACAVARHLESPVEYALVDLAKGEHQAPEYLAVNPNGKIPTLEDGDKNIWESNAIVCHLADRAGSDMWPKDERQTDVVRWMCWETAHFSRHAGTLLFQRFIKPQLQGQEPDATAVEEATGFFVRFAGVLDNHLQGRKYLVGDSLTVADFAVASMLPSAELAKLPLDGFHEIQKWHGRLLELPAWASPFPV